MMYNQLSVLDDDEDKADLHKVENPNDQISPFFDTTSQQTQQQKSTSIRNKNLVVISKLPSQPRDSLFGLLFILHLVLLILLSIFATKHKSDQPLIHENEKGTWSSILMIVTTLGSFFGALISFLTVRVETREILFNLGIVFSILFQVCLGNLLLLEHNFSIFGVLLLISAFFDFIQTSSARKNLNFTCALVDFSIQISQKYGLSLSLACIALVVVQTCLLLWWGVFIVGLLSSLPSDSLTTTFLLLAHFFSFLWITEFFQASISFLVGGCILSYFVAEEEAPPPPSRVLLLLQCCMSTSFGSLARSALLTPLAHCILVVDTWSKQRTGRGVGSSCVLDCLRSITPPLTAPLLPFAAAHSKLGLSLCASFGRTLPSASTEQARHHPETVLLSCEDSSAFTLRSLSRAGAGVGAVVVGLIVDRHEGRAWALLFFLLFLLLHSGLSLSLAAYCSAVQALIVSFSLSPESLQTHNQIVFLRFLRNSETSLR